VQLLLRQELSHVFADYCFQSRGLAAPFSLVSPPPRKRLAGVELLQLALVPRSAITVGRGVVGNCLEQVRRFFAVRPPEQFGPRERLRRRCPHSQPNVYLRSRYR